MKKQFKIEKGRIFNHRDGMSELKIFEEQLKEKDMNDKEFGITNVGTDGIQQIPLEMKEPTLLKEAFKLQEEIKNNQETFATTSVLPVEKKKRGRPSKKHIGVDLANSESDVTVREFRCATCRELIHEKNLMKIGAGDNRWAIFCPYCQKSLGFLDQAMLDKVQALIDNNPTGK